MKQLGTKLFVSFVSSVLLVSHVEGATILIKPDGTGDQPTIQAGIDAAASGDTVLLAAGTYMGAGNKDLDFGGKNLVVRSESGPEVTTIDCENSGHGFVFQHWETAESVLDGLTIQHGYCLGPLGPCSRESCPAITHRSLLDSTAADGAGAGMFAIDSSPTIKNCVFVGNRAGTGGAVLTRDYSTFVNCTFSQNYSEGGGGAVACWVGTSEFTNCSFLDNHTSPGGGGGAVAGNGTFTDCDFSRNRCGQYPGGAIWGDGAFTGCTFLENQAMGGGGAICGNGTITDCTFSENRAGGSGGAIRGGGTIANCAFLGNSALGYAPEISDHGGAIYGSGTITNCTFSENNAHYGGAISGFGDVAIANCIFFGNKADYGVVVFSGSSTITSCTLSENLDRGGYISCSGVYVFGGTPLIEDTIIAFNPGAGVVCDGGTPTLSCCDIYGNAGGDGLCGIDGGGNFSLDPGFCGILGTGNFDLKSNSPCAPGHHPNGADCGLIGARPVLCGAVAVKETTWGGIKALYR